MNLKLINKNGETLDLLKNKNKFILKATEGLHGVEVSYSESESPYADGTNIDSVKALPRGITLTFKLIGNIKNSLDYFTNHVKSKQMVTLVEEENGREISIKGVASVPPYSRMTRSCEITLSIYCGQPYWEDVDRIIGAIASSINLLNFPEEGQYFTAIGRPFGEIDTSLEKTFINDGDTDVGMTIAITALGEVKTPRISCSTGNQNGWYLQLSATLKDDDELIINTEKRNKTIQINGIDTYEGVPLLSLLEFKGTDWLQLEQGSNTFNITAESGDANVYFTITYKRKYE